MGSVEDLDIQQVIFSGIDSEEDDVKLTIAGNHQIRFLRGRYQRLYAIQ